MPFDTFLLMTLKHGTSVTEKGVTVRVSTDKKQASGSNEIILFFKTDDQMVRQDIGIQKNEPICDYLIYYSREDKKAGIHDKVLCLVDLKGSDVKHAMEQINNTYEHLIRYLEKRPCKPHIRHVKWKAYICCHPKSAIEQTKSYPDELKRLTRNFKSAANYGITHNEEMGPFLRR